MFFSSCLEHPVAQRCVGKGLPALHPATCSATPECSLPSVSSLELASLNHHAFQFVPTSSLYSGLHLAPFPLPAQIR